MSNSYSSRENDYRKICDSCWKPVKPGPRGLCAGGAITIWGASRLRSYRPLAKRALKFYNKSKLKRFKLKKVYKVNLRGARRYCYMTFRAQEDGSEERPLFRGVVKIAGRDNYKVLFCEIKDDDKITLPPDIDTDVSSDEDRPPRARKNDLGDGSMTDCGGAEHG